MKKFSLLEGFKYSDDEIEDFFIEYIDAKQFTLTTGFINSEMRFSTDIGSISKNTKQCKHIKIVIEDIAKGKSMDDIEKLHKIITTIRAFYLRSGEQPNYVIETRWDDVEINFYIIGDIADTTHMKIKETIKSLQSELVTILKGRGYKRVSQKSDNWVEVLTPKKGNADMILLDILRRANQDILTVNAHNQPLIDWIGKIRQSGLQFTTPLGDNQVVIKLKQ